MDTDPLRRGGGEKGCEAGFPMSDALGIHKRGLSALSSSPSEESVVSLCHKYRRRPVKSSSSVHMHRMHLCTHSIVCERGSGVAVCVCVRGHGWCA